MAQHDYVIDNSTGANVRADINSVLQAIASNNSGSSAPSTTYAFQLFADTTNNVMKIRNAANNAFIELFQLDGTFTLEDGSASTPALAFRDDLDTGIFSSGANEFNISTGGVERFVIDNSGNVGIGNISPQTAFHVFKQTNDRTARFQRLSGQHLDIKQTAGANSFISTGKDFEIGTTDSQNFIFDTNGSERMRITSAGLVGIGTSSPAKKLHIQDATPTLRIEGTNNLLGTTVANVDVKASHFRRAGYSISDENDIEDAFIGRPYGSGSTSSPLVFETQGSEKLRITSDGKCGIGTSSPDTPLHVHKGSAGSASSDGNAVITAENTNHCIFQMLSPNNVSNRIMFGDPEDANAGEIQYNHTNNDLIFQTAGNQRIRINSSGQVGIGTSSPNVLLDAGGASTNGLAGLTNTNFYTGFANTGTFGGIVAGSGATGNSPFIGASKDGSGNALSLRFITDATARMTIDTSGNIGAPTGTNIFNASDSRVKTNIVDLDKGLTAIKSLRPVSFNWINGFCDVEKNTLYGFIAQEVQTVDNNLIEDFAKEITINENKIENILRVNEKFIIPMLVKAIQELSAKVETLEAA